MFPRCLSAAIIAAAAAAMLLPSTATGQGRFRRRGRVIVGVVPVPVYGYGYYPRDYLYYRAPSYYWTYYPSSTYATGVYGSYPTLYGGDPNANSSLRTESAAGAQYDLRSAYPPERERIAAPATMATQDIAVITVDVPDTNAKVWFQGKLTRQNGTVREFESPPLVPGQEYVYHVRARWAQNGSNVDETRDITVLAGDRLTVDFSSRSHEEEKQPAGSDVEQGAPPPIPPEEQPPRSNRPVP